MGIISNIAHSMRRVFLPAAELRATLENPNTPLSDESIWDSLGYSTSDTGVTVTPEKALSVAAVWQAVNLISGDAAKLPLNLYRKTEDEDRSVEKNHPAQRLVRRRPNEEMSAFHFWRTAFVQKIIWGNAYLYIERDLAGRPLSLLPLLPDRTEAKRKNGLLYYVTEVNQRKLVPIDAANIIHLRGISIDGVSGCAWLKYARETIGRSLAAGGFASRFFKNGMRAGGILMLPPNLSKEARDKVEKGYRQFHENSDNAFKTMVLRDNAKFQQLTVAPNEGQMNETREAEVREVARFFNLAPSRLGLSDSVSYNSKAEDNQAYLDSTLSPHLIELTQELWAKLLTQAEQDQDELYFEHNTRALTQMNPLQRHQIYALGIRTGLYNPDECRGFENINKRADGKGDQYVLQTNLTDANPADNRIGNAGNQGIGADTGDPGSGRSDDQTLEQRRILFAIARAARHKAEKPHAFRQWLEGNLVGFRTEATAAGLADTEFDSLLTELNDIQTRTAPGELFHAVDNAMTELENNALGFGESK